MNSVVVFGERLLEQVGPQAVELSKALTNQAEEFGVGLLLRAALDDHRWQFVLLTRRKLDFHQFVTRFFEIQAGHDGQVNGSAQIDKVGVGLILDFNSTILLDFFVVRAVFIGTTTFVLVVAAFPENFGLQSLVGLFVLLVVCVELENIQAVFHTDVAIQVELVGDLILLFH